MSQKYNIGWADCTINPISGCLNDCPYCYARSFANRLKGRCGYPAENPFQPTFHKDKIDDILNLKGKGKRIFLDSMGDWFSEGVPYEWVQTIIATLWEVPEHNFLVLTKRPDRISEILHCIDLPKNLWLGVSVTCQEDYWRVSKLKESIPCGTKRFISFEPLHGLINRGNFGGVDWVIIGIESGNRKCKIPGKAPWIYAICNQARSAKIPVFLKNDICGPDGNTWKEFPEGLH